MIVFIDDERWTIQAYIDELELKSLEKYQYQPKHFYFPKDALDFAINNFKIINAFIVDIGMDYGVELDLMNHLPGGIEFIKNIKENPNLNKIPIIILTVYDKHQIEISRGIDLNSDNLIMYIDRNQTDRDKVLWDNIDSAIVNSCFNNI